MVIDTAEAGLFALNGTSRKAPFDRWFRYPAGLSTDSLALLFDPIRNPDGHPVLDPFCGAGTVGTQAVDRGFNFVGVEAHPEIAELAEIKLASGSPTGSELRSVSNDVVEAARPSGVEMENSLVRRCFSEPILAELVGLRELIQADESSSARYLKWALLGSLRDVANVKVGWPYLRPSLPRNPPHKSAARRFQERVSWMADDLDSRHRKPTALVLSGDSGDGDTWKQLDSSGSGKPGVCLTSPPYLNNFDYADATRLEMFFWGRNQTWSDMVKDVRSSMLVATTQQASVPEYERAMDSLAAWPMVRLAVGDLSIRLEIERQKRRAGKTYDRVLPSYMLGMLRVLEQVKDRSRPGSWCGWVIGDSAPYGIYVDTPELIRLAAFELGFEGAETYTIRDRGLKWRTNGTKHQVALNERLIWFRTPS